MSLYEVFYNSITCSSLCLSVRGAVASVRLCICWFGSLAVVSMFIEAYSKLI